MYGQLMFGMHAVQVSAYDTQQSSYFSAVAPGTSGYGAVASGYGVASSDNAGSTVSKYPAQTAYYQGTSVETPSYYTRQ